MRLIMFILSLMGLVWLAHFHHGQLMSDHYYLIATSADKRDVPLIAFAASMNGLKADPYCVAFYAFMGVGYAKAGKYEDAILCYDKVFKYYPWQINTMLNSAIAHVKAGKLKEADRLLDELVKIKPSYEPKKRSKKS